MIMNATKFESGYQFTLSHSPVMLEVSRVAYRKNGIQYYLVRNTYTGNATYFAERQIERGTPVGATQMSKKEYTYRNLPCFNLEYCVTGSDTGSNGYGAGILEWCYDLRDAQDRLNRMRQHSRFQGLKIERNQQID